MVRFYNSHGHNLRLRLSENVPFGIEIVIGIGGDINAMAVFVDFDPDSDEFSQNENFIS